MSTDPTDPPVSEPPAPAEFAETLHFDFPGSDIVLRSCDSHNFRVSKLYISNSSPVLRELMKTVSNTSTSDVANDEEPEPLPVVELPENGATLHSLLTLIFPVVPTLPSTLEKIMELLAVAQKYRMESVLFHIRCVIARKDPPFVRPETAFRIYFLARQHELHEEAVQSARVTLCLPMVIEDLGDKLEISDMTGTYLHDLWKYHERIRADLKSGLPVFQRSGLPDVVKTLRCSRASSYYDDSYHTTPVLPWLNIYLDSIADAPHLFDIFSFENARAYHVQALTKPCSCMRISSQVMRSIWEALTTVVHETIERVRRASVFRFIAIIDIFIRKPIYLGRFNSGSRE